MRFALRLLVVCGLLGAATLVLGNTAERWLIYPFDSTRVSPAVAGLTRVREVTFDSDGVSLLAWVAAPRRGKPVILYFHGNAGNLATRAGRLQRFLDRGYGLFAPAYRGSSGSDGKPVEEALIRDAEVAFRTLFQHLPVENGSAVVVYGESLGTAVALSLFESVALDDTKGFGAPAGLILEAPFTSIRDMAALHYPQLAPLAEKLANQWPSLNRAGRVGVPLLVIHGTEDTLIPIQMGRQVFAAAPSREKEFIAVKGAGHTDLWRSDLLPRLWGFVDQFALR